MKAVEMMIEFNRLAESVYRIYATSDRLDPYDIEGYLNKAQDQYLKDRFLSYQTPLENVTAINRAYDELSVLITNTGPALTTAEDGYGQYAQKLEEVPNNYLYYVRSSSKVTRTSIEAASDKWVENTVIGLDKLLRGISGPGNYPIIINPLTYLVDGNVYVLRDAYTTINEFSLDYLFRPKELSLDSDNECELPQHWHYDVADYAVRLYLQQQKERQKDDSS
jgi:hypothetical protein